MRKVFLDNLPRCVGTNNGKISWKNSVGYEVKFIYDDIEGYVKIIDYVGKRLIIKYNENIKSMAIGQFGRCEFGVLIGKISHTHKFNVGDIIDNVNSGSLEILEQIRIGKKQYKGYKYKCRICGNIDKLTESNILQRAGCSVCCSNSRKVLIGYNDLWTTHPYIAKFLKNSEDGYVFSGGSNKKVIFKCPDCGFERKATINDITSDGFSCTICGDGISFPEKFMSSLLNQLNITFEREKSFGWSEGKRYDFYIESINCIIETHGIQHYAEGFNNGRNLHEEKINDEFKHKLAISNNIKNYIIINCRESELNFIKHNLLTSELNNLFDLQNIDWIKCTEFALNNLIKEVSEMWMNSSKNMIDISKIYNVSKACVRNYLKKGAKLGWCDYDSKTNNRDSKSKEVICLNDKKKYISMCNAAKHYNISEGTINLSCQGKFTCNKEILNNTYLQWQFYDEYLIKPKKLLTIPQIDEIKNNSIYTRKVICLNNNKVFNSIKEASKWAGLKTSAAICSNCRNHQKSAGKDQITGEPLKWMYYEDYLKLNNYNAMEGLILNQKIHI